jgi:hypothetical protein
LDEDLGQVFDKFIAKDNDPSFSVYGIMIVELKNLPDTTPLVHIICFYMHEKHLNPKGDIQID